MLEQNLFFSMICFLFISITLSRQDIPKVAFFYYVWHVRPWLDVLPFKVTEIVMCFVFLAKIILMC